MKLVFWIILFSFTLFSCADRDKVVKPFDNSTEVIAVFTPNKIGEYADVRLNYMAMVKVTDSLGLAFRPIFPGTYEEGAEMIAQLVSRNELGRKRLVISTDSEYSTYLREVASQGKIIDSDSTKLLVLDGGLVHPDIYTAHIPYYGTMYKAGYIASRMEDVDSVRIYLANSKYLYMREGRDGFIDGFTQNRENTIDVVDFSIHTLSDTEGLSNRTAAYMFFAPECCGRFDMILPICGETTMGFIQYNRDNPGCFYTIGVDDDMSIYSSDVPFSCVKHSDRVITACITDWKNGQLEHYQSFGMEGNWVELVVADKYKHLLEPLSQEIHNQAIEEEANYEK